MFGQWEGTRVPTICTNKEKVELKLEYLQFETRVIFTVSSLAPGNISSFSYIITVKKHFFKLKEKFLLLRFSFWFCIHCKFNIENN